MNRAQGTTPVSATPEELDRLLSSHRPDLIGIVGTDAPLLPNQCERLAQRAALGVARTGGVGEHTSGDLFLAFATGNRGLAALEVAFRRAEESYVELEIALSDCARNTGR